MKAIVYNLVRFVMLREGKRQGIVANHISFIDAQRWRCHARGSTSTELPSCSIGRIGLNRAIKRRLKEQAAETTQASTDPQTVNVLS
jgi:hypothetical protein